MQEEGGKLTLLGEQPFPLDDRRLEGGAGSTVAAVGGGGGSGGGRDQGGGATGHHGLHTRSVEAGHALALVQPQLASGVLHALPLLEEEQRTLRTRAALHLPDKSVQVLSLSKGLEQACCPRHLCMRGTL